MTKYQVGDIVKHPGRKTLLFAVAEVRDRDVIIKRVEKSKLGDYVVQAQYKGYRVPFSDPMTVVDRIDMVVPKAKVFTVAELRKAGFFSNIANEFENLQSEFSPENLSCDGELSRAQVAQKVKELNRKWELLESYVGLKVSRSV
jgi:hypothetical protein